MMPPDISVAELHERRTANAPFVLLDVREADELAAASLSGVTHIPMKEIPARLDELPKDGDIAVLCHAGGRSAMVVKYLRDRGFTSVANVTGGIDAWSTQIDATVPRY